MKTLRLYDGDLAIGPSADYQMVTGKHKVSQDVRAALMEPLGNDRFHPGWGSSLHDLVGDVLSEDVRSDALVEVNRVVGNYAAIQRDRVEADINSGGSSRFTTDEIVSAVTGVRADAFLDSLKVQITIGTVSNDVVEIEDVVE